MQHHYVGMLRLLARQIAHTNDLEYELDQLTDAVQSLANGVISPYLIPVNVLVHTLSKIQHTLTNRFPNFHIANIDARSYYQSANFLFGRRGSKLFITLKIPLTSFKSTLYMYKVRSYPVPINKTSSHASQILDLPDYYISTESNDYYSFVSSADLAVCTRKKAVICPFSNAFHPSTSLSCTSSLFTNHKSNIFKLCDFRFRIDALLPQLTELTPSTVLAYDIDLIAVDCNSHQKMLQGCKFCVLHVPCRCSLSTKDLYFPPRLASCSDVQETISVEHPINLALIQSFFNDSLYSTIAGDTTFSNPIDIDIPQFQLFNHSLDKILAQDKKAHLSLSRLVARTKARKVAYATLADPILDGSTEAELSWPTFDSIMSISGVVLASAATLACIYMFLRLRTIYAMMVLVQTARAKADDNLPRFRYNMPSTTPYNPLKVFEDLEFSIDHSLITAFVVQSVLLLILMLCIVYQMYRKRYRHSSTVLLEITTGSQCVFVPIVNLTKCITHYQIQAPSSVSNLQLFGSLRPQLYVDLQDMIICDISLNKDIPIQPAYQISLTTAWKLRKMLKQPFCAYIVVEHYGYLLPTPESSKLTLANVPSNSLYPSLQ